MHDLFLDMLQDWHSLVLIPLPYWWRCWMDVGDVVYVSVVSVASATSELVRSLFFFTWLLAWMDRYCRTWAVFFNFYIWKHREACAAA